MERILSEFRAALSIPAVPLGRAFAKLIRSAMSMVTISSGVSDKHRTGRGQENLRNSEQLNQWRI
jgi:hypothetical protein